eukprot:TRINITY_DN5839_c0_g1_i1.p1 TRINITY_DN5839_c0_g1~~TRINITY_DN5839_c0_g1_i1.p1  ORF type:complete len:284 (-),score=38.81 TRINITY_DN5839_c0_g1_i1:112-963(-)
MKKKDKTVKVKEIQFYEFTDNDSTLKVKCKTSVGDSISYRLERTVAPAVLADGTMGCCCRIEFKTESMSELHKESIESAVLEASRAELEIWLQLAKNEIDLLPSIPDASPQSPYVSQSPNPKLKESLLGVARSLAELRTALAENQERLLSQKRLYARPEQGAIDQKLRENLLLDSIDSTFEQYMDRLAILTLRQKEAEEQSLQQEEVWKVKLEESRKKLNRITKRLRYPIIFASKRQFFAVAVFLLAWPMFWLFCWRKFGRATTVRYLNYLDIIVDGRRSPFA